MEDRGGVAYNPHRHQAVRHVELADSLNQVIAAIEEKEGKNPLLLPHRRAIMMKRFGNKIITYFEQERVWQSDRPVLLLFGTGHGIAPEVCRTVRLFVGTR